MRTRFVWATDIHLDVLEEVAGSDAVLEFVHSLNGPDPAFVVLTGDISIAPSLPRHLMLIETVVKCPVYFVCGNHDYYDGSFKAVRKLLARRCADNERLKYMTSSGPVHVTSGTALVGHDGWYDAYHGDALSSNVLMNDWIKIEDFANAGVVSRGTYGGLIPKIPTAISIARKAAHEAAQHVRVYADAAAKMKNSVLIMTHVPPWPMAHDPQSMKGSPSAIPWYSSKLMGDAIESVAAENPSVKFNVLCGHTHNGASSNITSNVTCHVGSSEYGSPQFNIVEIP